jgi:hypothetical protein
MSFGLGFWAAAGAGVATDYELIATSLPTGSSAATTFSSIPQTYKHLQIRYAVRNNESIDGVRGFFIQFAGGGTSDYRSHILLGSGGSISSSSTSLDTRIVQDFVPANNSTSGAFGIGVIDILDYAVTTKNKTVRMLAGSLASSATRVGLISGARFATDAISTIEVYSNGNFINGSRISLYGIKG